MVVTIFQRFYELKQIEVMNRLKVKNIVRRAFNKSDEKLLIIATADPHPLWRESYGSAVPGVDADIYIND